MSIPPAMTAIVPLASAPACAAASMPRAKPETTTRPSPARSCASVRAKRIAPADALRAPTIATAGRASRPVSPATISTGGALSISPSSDG
jgi:hypothetical protein